MAVRRASYCAAQQLVPQQVPPQPQTCPEQLTVGQWQAPLTQPSPAGQT
jgi:hypothetical protein